MRKHNRDDIPDSGWRRTAYIIIFEADTYWGKIFDVGLIIFIVVSVGIVMLDSVRDFNMRWGEYFLIAEWFCTIAFTIEYLLRLLCTKRPARYAFSFFGVVDLLAIIPTYVSLFIPHSQYLIVIRILRVLRAFRILKFMKFVGEADVLMHALYRSRRKITIFLFSVLSLVVILGSLMYLIEGEENGFTSIPRSVYWAIVTLTTVGYGNVAPQTPLGQALAATVMILGYAILAVPTGIVSVELSQVMRENDARSCKSCGQREHEPDSQYCRICGEKL